MSEKTPDFPKGQNRNFERSNQAKIRLSNQSKTGYDHLVVSAPPLLASVHSPLIPPGVSCSITGGNGTPDAFLQQNIPQNEVRMGSA